MLRMTREFKQTINESDTLFTFGDKYFKLLTVLLLQGNTDYCHIRIEFFK